MLIRGLFIGGAAVSVAGWRDSVGAGAALMFALMFVLMLVDSWINETLSRMKPC